mgnify:CR=1 FL=1
MRVQFTVSGSPQGKGRPRFSTHGGRGITHPPDKTAIYENLVRLEYERQCQGNRFSETAALSVEIFAYYDIPQSASKKQKQAMRDRLVRPTKKPDFDNIGKTICDSLNGYAYRDDAQVVDGSVHKFYSDVPRVEVIITEIGGTR